MNFREKYGSLNKLHKSPYDKRDYKFSSVSKPVEIPENFETADADFTFDQGNTSMCFACAYNYLRFLQEKDNGLKEKLSPGFTYGDRYSDEIFEGMFLRSGFKKGKEDGNVLFSSFPYWGTVNQLNEKFNSKKDELLKDAEPYKTDSYYVCSSRHEIQTAIMQTKCVVIGIPVYKSFYYPDKNGVITYKKGELSDGGHAIAIRGWKTIKGKLYWIIKNSWGEKWGINGCALLPAEYPWQDNAYAAVRKC